MELCECQREMDVFASAYLEKEESRVSLVLLPQPNASPTEEQVKHGVLGKGETEAIGT